MYVHLFICKTFLSRKTKSTFIVEIYCMVCTVNMTIAISISEKTDAWETT